MDIKSPLPSLLHNNKHASPPTCSKQQQQQATLSKPTKGRGKHHPYLFQLSKQAEVSKGQTMGDDGKNSMGNQSCIMTGTLSSSSSSSSLSSSSTPTSPDALCHLSREASDTPPPPPPQNAAIYPHHHHPPTGKKKAYTLPPLRYRYYNNNNKSADFAVYDDPSKPIPTDELALFMRNKKRYCPPNFRPIPPSPGGWETPPDHEIAWEMTCAQDDSPFLHLKSLQGPLDLPWKSTLVSSSSAWSFSLPSRHRHQLQKSHHQSGEVQQQQQQQQMDRHTVCKPQDTQPPLQQDAIETPRPTRWTRPPPSCFNPSSPFSSMVHPKRHSLDRLIRRPHFEPPPPLMDRVLPPPLQQQQQPFDPHQSYFARHHSYFEHPPPWTAAPFSPFDSPPPPPPPPPPQRHRTRSMGFDEGPKRPPTSDLEDLLLMEDRSISILRVLEDNPPTKPSHRLYYNFSDYVVVSDA